jgi:hypothetical protein
LLKEQNEIIKQIEDMKPKIRRKFLNIMELYMFLHNDNERIWMKSNAPGQLLGYALQFPRALYHLLRSGAGDTVSIEVLGDVAIIESSGEVTLEEDKSSIVGNPLTDRSTDLWKTFANWIEIINDKNLDVRKTKFILYCNQSGRHGIVDEFSSAQNQLDAQKAIDLDRYTPQLCCGWDKPSINFKRKYILLKHVCHCVYTIGETFRFRIKTELESAGTSCPAALLRLGVPAQRLTMQK